MVIVLDNVEHLLDGVEHVASILRASPGSRIIATSRAPRNHGRARGPGPPAGRRRRPAVHRACAGRSVPAGSLGTTGRWSRISAGSSTTCRSAWSSRRPRAAAAASSSAIGWPRGYRSRERPSATPGAPADAGGDVRLEPRPPRRRAPASCCMTWQCSTTDLDADQVGSEAEPADGTDRLTDVLELADQNLLMADGRGTGRARFRMLRTIQSFALARLVAGAGGGGPGPARRCLSHAGPGRPALARDVSPRRGPRSHRTRHGQPPLGASLADRLGAGSRALELVAALWRFRHAFGHLAEGRRVTEEALASPSAPTSGSSGLGRPRRLAASPIGRVTRPRRGVGMTRRSNSPQRPTTRRASPTRSSTAATCSSWGPGTSRSTGRASRTDRTVSRSG